MYNVEHHVKTKILEAFNFAILYSITQKIKCTANISVFCMSFLRQIIDQLKAQLSQCTNSMQNRLTADMTILPDFQAIPTYSDLVQAAH